MKNRRDVCAATEAGFTEYKGLPGVIKTGCQLTPAYKSNFCFEHSPRVGKMTCEEEPPQENVVALIVGKKQTRSGTYYQVLSNFTQLSPWCDHPYYSQGCLAFKQGENDLGACICTATVSHYGIRKWSFQSRSCYHH